MGFTVNMASRAEVSGRIPDPELEEPVPPAHGPAPLLASPDTDNSVDQEPEDSRTETPSSHNIIQGSDQGITSSEHPHNMLQSRHLQCSCNFSRANVGSSFRTLYVANWLQSFQPIETAHFFDVCNSFIANQMTDDFVPNVEELYDMIQQRCSAHVPAYGYLSHIREEILLAVHKDAVIIRCKHGFHSRRDMAFRLIALLHDSFNDQYIHRLVPKFTVNMASRAEFSGRIPDPELEESVPPTHQDPAPLLASPGDDISVNQELEVSRTVTPSSHNMDEGSDRGTHTSSEHPVYSFPDVPLGQPDSPVPFGHLQCSCDYSPANVSTSFRTLSVENCL